jgi:hypothetical protein
MDDDDVPPPLSGLKDQVQALTPSTTSRVEDDHDASLPVAATTVVPWNGKAGAVVSALVMCKIRWNEPCMDL